MPTAPDSPAPDSPAPDASAPDAPYRVAFVCTGNICRSPMGESMLRHLVEEAGLDDRVEVDSWATSHWEAGNGADPRTIRTLQRHGYALDGHRSRQMTAELVTGRDLVLVADTGHLRAVRSLAGRCGDQARADVRLVRSLDPEAVAAGDLELEDPWYGEQSDFETCFAQLEPALRAVVDALAESIPPRLPDAGDAGFTGKGTGAGMAGGRR